MNTLFALIITIPTLGDGKIVIPVADEADCHDKAEAFIVELAKDGVFEPPFTIEYTCGEVRD